MSKGSQSASELRAAVHSLRAMLKRCASYIENTEKEAMCGNWELNKDHFPEDFFLYQVRNELRDTAHLDIPDTNQGEVAQSR